MYGNKLYCAIVVYFLVSWVQYYSNNYSVSPFKGLFFIVKLLCSCACVWGGGGGCQASRRCMQTVLKQGMG